MNRLTLAALVAAIALSACGDGDEGEGDAAVTGNAGGTEESSGGEPCSLLTEDEVAAAMGEDEATAEPGSTGPSEDCTWTGPQPPAGEVATAKTIVLSVYPGEEFFAPDSYAADAEPVSGLGDDAALSPATKTVMWLQDGNTFQLQFVTLDDVPSTRLEELARAAGG